MTDLTPVMEEAIRELNIPDGPDLYHRLRSLAVKCIKHRDPEPVDTMNWPKGMLMTGLMHTALSLSVSEDPKDRARSIRNLAEVKDHLNRWIASGAQVYRVDDCLAGQALLMLIVILGEDCETKFRTAAAKIMQFLYDAPKDIYGAIPYRPGQKNGRIFADGIGMTAPFAVGYGLLSGDGDALQLGLDQITAFMEHGLEEGSGLPWHAYSVNGDLQHFGDLGWGRGTGWIMYGLGAAYEAAEIYADKNITSPELIAAKTKLRGYLYGMADTLRRYMRSDGLFGSLLTDPDSQPDTSASAMILYGMKCAAGEGNIPNSALSAFEKYITADGRVTQAQGECIDFGTYGEYGSYPWSVGSVLLL